MDFQTLAPNRIGTYGGQPYLEPPQTTQKDRPVIFSEQRSESDSVPYIESLSSERTPLAV